MGRPARALSHLATGTALTVAIALFGAAPADGTFPGKNGPIAYEALPRIGVIQPGGGSQRELVSFGSGPSYLPGSRQLAYIRVVGFNDKTFRGHTRYSIYVKSVHPDHPRAPGRRITGQRAFEVRDIAVTPNGERIVFVGRRPSSRPGPEFDVWSISIAGNKLHRLTRNRVFDNDVDVSPDGRHVAYVEKVGGRAQIFVMDLDGSNQHRLTFDRNRDRSPHWSPDGRRIVFFSAPGKGGRSKGDTDIWSIGSNGGALRHLARNAEDPVYSPDGRRIAFLRDYEIWSMGPNGDRQRRLSRPGAEPEITSLDWGSLAR